MPRAQSALNAQTPPTILIADDDASLREDLTAMLQEHGYHCLEAKDGKHAQEELAARRIDVLLLDLILPRLNGTQVLKYCLQTHPEVPVIMISGKGTIAAAVEAVKLGAFDFLEKPLERDYVLKTLQRALQHRASQLRCSELLFENEEAFELVGKDPSMVKVQQLIDNSARVDSKVLITGESGTGKELVARAIHRRSKRRHSKFVPINCSAIPEDLIESTLFGHVKGAFSGASANHTGKFQEADGGTLLLDEIGDMSLVMQPKVLRVIEDGVIEPVGSNKPTRVNVRIIAATHKDLRDEIGKGNFREDLFYRLNVLTIHLPPLRERKGDLPALAESLLQQLCRRENLAPVLSLAPEVWPLLEAHHWPGNVRELRNVLERAAAVTTGMIITGEVVAEALRAASREPHRPVLTETLHARREQVEADFIRETLRKNGGRVQASANELGIHRNHLWKKMQHYGINKTDFL